MYMNNELISAYLEELESRKDIFTDLRYDWMKSINEDTEIDKLCNINGYLMAMRDTGHNIGNLKVLIEQLILCRRSRR